VRPAEVLARRAHVLDLLEHRFAGATVRAIAGGQARADAISGRLHHAIDIARARIASRIESAAIRLQVLDPQQVLARGYTLLAEQDGRPITSVAALVPGAVVSARLADGTAEMTVHSTMPEPASR
jgi:exodeoxyribonuclease VII large subunit